MLKAKAPGGAFSASTSKPAMGGLLPQRQDSAIAGEQLDGSPTRIKRMLQQLFPNELEIKAWQDQADSPGTRYAMHNGKVQWVAVKELVGDSIKESTDKRDAHLADLRQAIDFALTDAAFEDVPCHECRLPSDPLDFAAALPDFQEPATQCAVCQDLGSVRSRRTDDQSVADEKRVKYWSTVLDDFIRCCKIKAKAADADQAYLELETANRNLLIKFGNEKQTSLEGDDALQGVRQGIVDAAIRFDPTRKEGAQFATVAYNWCRRNSRARQSGQKRAGVYAPSIESMGTDEDGNGAAAMIQSSEGALGTFEAPTSAGPSLVLDLREKLKQLPEMQREVMTCELAGMGTGEISARLDITKVKVRKLRERAFTSLRSSMAGYASVRALSQ